jgi:hypothetical protein
MYLLKDLVQWFVGLNGIVYYYHRNVLLSFGSNPLLLDFLRGRMTAKEGPSSFTLVLANISWRFVRLDLKSCF